MSDNVRSALDYVLEILESNGGRMRENDIYEDYLKERRERLDAAIELGIREGYLWRFMDGSWTAIGRNSRRS